ncbi:MAG: FtsX-like permease family protein [Spirochaetaceae bacterium]|nr:FtsX-like permease family protein [Spirochaetaceae bacterium]
MMKIFNITIAFRSLAAHRRKTWAIVLSISVGICALVLVGGYYEYTFWGLKESLIRSQYGHLQIYPDGYRQDRDADPFLHKIENHAALISLLEQDREIRVAAPRSKAIALVNENPVEIWGVDPERELELFTFFTSKRGSGLTSGDTGVCQMSPLLADTLGVKLNDTVTLTGVRKDSQLNAINVKIQSIMGSYAEEFDRMVLVVPSSTFLDLFGTDMIHEIAVLYRNDRDLYTQRHELQKYLIEQGWKTDIAIWYEQAIYYSQVVEYYKGFYRIVLTVVAIIVFFVTATTMSLSLFERTREFGTCLTMGTRKQTIIAQILNEALLTGMIGLIIGAIVSFSIAVIINTAGGIEMPAAPGMSGSIQVFIRFSIQAAAFSFVTAFVIPVMAIMVPARQIMSRTIVELLNG